MLSNQLQQALDTATAPLARDPDLRLEVRRELESHLQSSLETYKAAGHPTPDQAALADLGPLEDLSQKLLSANRSRLRRRTLARVMGGAIALPAATLATVFALPSVLLPFLAFLTLFVGGDFTKNTPLSFLADHSPTHYKQSYLAALPQETKLLLAKVEGHAWPDDKLVAAQKLAALHPTDPVYAVRVANAAYYIYDYEATQARYRAAEPNNSAHRSWSKLGLTSSDVLGHIEAARKIDPNNAHLDLLQAALLFNLSTRFPPDASDSEIRRYPALGRQGPETWELEHMIITDQVRYAEALRLLEDAAAKPINTPRVVEFNNRVLASLPPASSALERRYRADLLGGLADLTQNPRASSLAALNWASLDAAVSSNFSRATHLADLRRRLGQSALNSAQSSEEIYDAYGIFFRSYVAEYAIATLSNNRAAADAIAAKSVEYRKILPTIFPKLDKKTPYQWAFIENFGAYTDPDAPESTRRASRMAEYTLVDRAAAFTLAVLFLFPSVVGFTAMFLSKRNVRVTCPAPLPRWREWMFLVAVALLPMAAFFSLAMTGHLGRSVSLALNDTRTYLQYATLAALSTTLLGLGIRHLLLKRAALLGSPVTPARLWPILSALALLLIMAGFLHVELTRLIEMMVTNDWGPHHLRVERRIAIVLSLALLAYSAFSLPYLTSFTPKIKTCRTRDPLTLLAAFVAIPTCLVAAMLPAEFPLAVRVALYAVAAACWCIALYRFLTARSRACALHSAARISPAPFIAFPTLTLAGILLASLPVLAGLESRFAASAPLPGTTLDPTLQAKVLAVPR